MDNWRVAGILRAQMGRPKAASIVQITVLCALAFGVLLWDSLGVDVEFSLNKSVGKAVVDSSGLVGPKRNIVSVAETSDGGIELSPEPQAMFDEFEHPPMKPRSQIFKVDVKIDEESLTPKGAKKTEEELVIDTTEQPKKHRREPKKEEQQQLLVNSNPNQTHPQESSAAPESSRSPIPFSLGKTPKNWDQQRRAWLKKHPRLRTSARGNPRMLLVSGSQPWACKNPVGDHLMLKSMKNKIDYCRQHDIEIFYNFAHLDKEMSSYWAKLPILRSLMLSHPEIEWFFWMDSDAIFTDMLFEIPMAKYQDYNLIMLGYEEMAYTKKSWVAINNGVFFMRNCQWTLDLFDMWAPMGPSGQVRNEWGKLFTEFLTDRPVMPADDQSALLYLLLMKPELRPKVRLEREYELSGYWVDHVDRFEEMMVTDHPGLGDRRWPFTTHFTGCQPCSGDNSPSYTAETCAKQMERAYNFGDNQVLQMMGYQHENLDSVYTRRIREDSDRPLDFVGSNPWASASESYGI